MAGCCEVGWPLAKHGAQNCASSIDVVDDGSSNDFRARCGCNYQVCIALVGVQDRETMSSCETI